MTEQAKLLDLVTYVRSDHGATGHTANRLPLDGTQITALLSRYFLGESNHRD